MERAGVHSTLSDALLVKGKGYYVVAGTLGTRTQRVGHVFV